MSELKPCPFCGGKGAIKHKHDVDGCLWASVACLDCGCGTRGKWVSDSSDACPIFYAEVRDEWNRRPEPPRE